MLEVVSHFLAFISGALITALTLAWKYRKIIKVVIEWWVSAYQDGRITKDELAMLLIALGKSLKDVGVE